MSQAFLVPGRAAVLLALVLIAGGAADAAAPNFALDPYFAQTIDNLSLELTVTPQAISPGSTVTVELKVTNSGTNPASPEVTILIPNNAALKSDRLVPGTTYNIQDNSVSWMPIVPGDGQTSMLALEMTVNVANVKSPEQIVSVRLKDGFNESTQDASFWVGVLPEATVAFDPPQAAVGEPVKLIGNILSPGPNDQIWSLGDGRVVEADNPVVVYPAAGTYQVFLKVSNPLGPLTYGELLTIVPQPKARFELEDLSPGIDQPVGFTNLSGGQPPLSYSWSFGDGSNSTDPNPIHRYERPGIYQAQLLVQNEYGQDEAELTINVGEQPVADIIMNEVVSAGEVIEGQAFTDSTVNSIRWDMGDGRTLEGPYITHIYWGPGDYHVSMTASSDFGATIISRLVHVESGNLLLYLPLIHNVFTADLSAQNGVPLTRGLVDSLNPIQQVDLGNLQLPSTMSPAEQLVAFVNEARRQSNLGPLRYVYELSIAAQAHAEDMATSGYTGHTGSDGSSPPLRIQRAGYPGGYGGEATAWGMQHPNEPVEFWLDSPAHRAIVLHPAVTDIGVGYTQDYNSSNLWYWVAEFASPDLPVISLPSAPVQESPVDIEQARIELLGPPHDSEFALSAGNNLIFTWSWPLPLDMENGERFVVYLQTSARAYQLGIIRESAAGGQYQLIVPVDQVPVAQEHMEWLVRLEGSAVGQEQQQSQAWPIHFLVPTQASDTPSATAESPPLATATVPPPAQPTLEPAQTPLPVSTPVPTTVPGQ